jgi:hypothetical protein
VANREEVFEQLRKEMSYNKDSKSIPLYSLLASVQKANTSFLPSQLMMMMVSIRRRIYGAGYWTQPSDPGAAVSTRWVAVEYFAEQQGQEAPDDRGAAARRRRTHGAICA